nr:type II toxin-antitoxin system mRNA interferase toxin, RelE/StbE family [Acinetobacter radioresistens]
MIAHDELLGAEWVDHALSGNPWKNCGELHVDGNFLLIYRIETLSKFKMVILVHTGAYSELFK